MLGNTSHPPPPRQPHTGDPRPFCTHVCLPQHLLDCLTAPDCYWGLTTVAQQLRVPGAAAGAHIHMRCGDCRQGRGWPRLTRIAIPCSAATTHRTGMTQCLPCVAKAQYHDLMSRSRGASTKFDVVLQLNAVVAVAVGRVRPLLDPCLPKSLSLPLHLLALLDSLFDVVLQFCVRVWVVVDQVHLVTLNHHARIRSSNAASTNDANLRAQTHGQRAEHSQLYRMVICYTLVWLHISCRCQPANPNLHPSTCLGLM